jgi:hypothetical protein
MIHIESETEVNRAVLPSINRGYAAISVCSHIFYYISEKKRLGNICVFHILSGFLNVLFSED